jgi:hypothetical protein
MPILSPYTILSDVQCGAYLAPADCQMVFADLQTSLVANCKTVEPIRLAQVSAGLAQIAELLNIPVWFSVAAQEGTDPTIIPELKRYVSATNLFMRGTSSSFNDDELVSALSCTNRRTLVVAGFATGYVVYYVVDAVGGLSDRTEQASFRAMERAGAIPTSVKSLSARLAPDLSVAPGSDVLKVMMSIPEA